MIKQIGVMIRKQRKQVGLSQKMLCRGLCSVSDLSKLENGEREIDSITLSALVQRLGKSMNSFELMISEEEYQLILDRAMILELVQSGKLTDAEEVLEDYKQKVVYLQKDLHKQYILMMEAVIEYLRESKVEECLEKMLMAAELSFTEEETVLWEKGCFCLQEIQLFLLIAYLLMEEERWEEASALLKQILQMIEKNWTSDALKAGTYPKCCYLYALVCEKQNRVDEAFTIIEQGIHCLTTNGSLAFLDKLLELRLKNREDALTRSQLEAIAFLEKFRGESMVQDMMAKLLYFGTPGEVILNFELVKELRQSQKYSQEQLANSICARETLSKIEQGRLANQKNMQKLLQRLGVGRNTYYSFVVAEDFETYEMIRDYRRNAFTENRAGLDEMLEIISKRIDLSIPVNRQFVEAAKVMNSRRKGLLQSEQVIGKLTKCLKYTMPEYDGSVGRLPYREEMVILNTIARVLIKVGRGKEAIRLYHSIVQRYKKSKVIEEFHLTSMMLLYLNYSLILEEENYMEEAKVYGKEGLALMLKRQRGDIAAMLLANLSCVFEKEETQEGDKMCEHCSRHAYYLLQLFHCEKDSQIIKAYREAKGYSSRPS